MLKPLTPIETQRYSRHLILPEVGVEGQMKLRDARVLIVGTGGLGGPISLYLAAAGVGTLGVMDFDQIDLSNLQRQILFEQADIGKSKIAVAQKKLQALNPQIEVIAHDFKLTAKGALEIFQNYDLIVDGTDNFPTRYLMNDACILTGKPLIFGSISQFEGQATVFGWPGGPCYRCIYPEPLPSEFIPNCAQAGVLGVLPGIIGVIQATEVIKIILKKGDILQGRLLLFDALAMTFKELAVQKDPRCPICSDEPQITSLESESASRSYSMTCEFPLREIDATDLKRRLRSGEKLLILDVRTTSEYTAFNLGGISIPLDVLVQNGPQTEALRELEKTAQILVHCQSGYRSATAVTLLQKAGFSDVWNVKGCPF